jgi:hypothetical protein
MRGTLASPFIGFMIRTWLSQCGAVLFVTSMRSALGRRKWTTRPADLHDPAECGMRRGSVIFAVSSPSPHFSGAALDNPRESTGNELLRMDRVKSKKRRRRDAKPEVTAAHGAIQCDFYADDVEASRYTETGRQTLVQQVALAKF